MTQNYYLSSRLFIDASCCAGGIEVAIRYGELQEALRNLHARTSPDRAILLAPGTVVCMTRDNYYHRVKGQYGIVVHTDDANEGSCVVVWFVTSGVSTSLGPAAIEHGVPAESYCVTTDESAIHLAYRQAFAALEYYKAWPCVGVMVDMREFLRDIVANAGQRPAGYDDQGEAKPTTPLKKEKASKTRAVKK